jgi:8-oxo-dGTP pyrophosphatase MutT (NUDIX family)
MKVYDVVSALVTSGDLILLARQKSPVDSNKEYWGFPGGKMERDETHDVAMQREILEETGLKISEFGKPIFYCTYGDQDNTWSCSITAFHVEHDAAIPCCPGDPDGDVLEVGWFERDEAIRLIDTIPWASMREPILHYLEHGSRKTEWRYQLQEDGQYKEV